MVTPRVYRTIQWNRPARGGRAGQTVRQAGCFRSGRGSPRGRSAARRRAGGGSSVRDTGKPRAERVPRGVGRTIGSRPIAPGRTGRPPRPAGVSTRRSSSAVPSSCRSRSGSPSDRAPVSTPNPAIAPVPRRVLVGLRGRRLPGIAPIRPGYWPGRGSPFRVKRFLDVLARVVALRLRSRDRARAAGLPGRPAAPGPVEGPLAGPTTLRESGR